MKFTTGRLRAACDHINPTTGKWELHAGNWVVANENNFNSLHNTVDAWKHRDDRRNERVEFRYEGTQEYDVDTWSAVERYFAINFYSQISLQPWVVISGNPLDGFELIGPFATAEEAAEHASGDDGDWWTTRINAERQWQS